MADIGQFIAVILACSWPVLAGSWPVLAWPWPAFGCSWPALVGSLTDIG